MSKTKPEHMKLPRTNEEFTQWALAGGPMQAHSDEEIHAWQDWVFDNRPDIVTREPHPVWGSAEIVLFANQPVKIRSRPRDDTTQN